MKTFKKRLIPMLLALTLSLSLLPVTARAAEAPCDVYQGDGFYITATPSKLNSTKYRLPASNGSTLAGDLQFYDGLIMVYSDLDSDENYVNHQYVYELNWADRNGNIVLPEGSLKANAQVYNHSKYHFSVSEGILAYWDGESTDGSAPIYGFMDTKGNILTPCLYSNSGLLGFRDGVNVVYNEVSRQRECIDTRGNVLFALDTYNPRVEITVYSPYDNGLAPGGTAVFDSTGNSVISYGFWDKQGNMALKLLSYSKADRSKTDDLWDLCAAGKTDGYLVPRGALMSSPGIGGTYGFVSGNGSGGFSEGYAVCYDLRSGNRQDPHFAIIDTTGRVVGAFSDAKPLGDVHDGLIRVDFINNRGGSDGIGFVDVTGKVVLRDVPRDDEKNGKRNFQDDFSCGVTLDQSRVVDTKGNTVIPNSHFFGYSPNGFQDNLCLTFARSNNAPYLLEMHQGAYTGPGRVYNHSQGGEVSAPSVQPETPAQPVQPQQPAGAMAYASTQSVDVDGRKLSFQMYALKDANGNPTNYIKLRDVAFALNGTAAQFEVSWDGAVNIRPGQTYTPNGSEMSTPFSGDRAYEPAASETRINAAAANLEAIVLKDDQGGAYTYYKLRDLGKALGFNVGWSGERGIFVETDKPYQD